MDYLKINEIYNDDCKYGIKQVEPIVDLVIADPPFGIEFKSEKKNYNREKANVIDGYTDIKPENYYAFTFGWIYEVNKVLKPSGAMYIFSGWNNLYYILRVLEELGLKTINHLIWKYQFGVHTTKKYISSHYHLLYVAEYPDKVKFNTYCRFNKEAKSENGTSMNYQDREDVWNIKREYWTGEKKVPTKLPQEIIKKIIEYSSNPGDLILDPFVGSGQVPFVCKKMNRNFIGFEIVPEYYDFAAKRINNIKEW